MAVSTIYTLSDSVVAYSNDNDGYIEFTLCMEFTAEDMRELEEVRLGNGAIARNLINITDAFVITLTMNEISEEDRDILAEAHQNQDDSGMLTLTQSNKNSSIVKTTTWNNVVPRKDHNFNINLAESIKSKRVIIVFGGDEPETTYG